MHPNQILSAVARRKAALISISTTTDEQESSSFATAVNPPSALPLKRKAQAPVCTSAETFGSDTNLRKSPRTEKLGRTSRGDSTALENSTFVRAYSPSQPFADSLDNGQAPALSESSGPRDFSVRSNTKDSTNPLPKAAQVTGSIFKPVNGQNLFNVSVEEALGITKQPVPGCLLLIRPGESLVFVGTMQLALLQGRVELMGVSLLPSKTCHRVFAPRSHPIPTISVPPTPETPPSTHIPLSRILPHISPHLSPIHSVIFVQELSTGVQGLGRIVQPFGSMFEPDLRDTMPSYDIVRGFYALEAEPQYDQLFVLPRDWETTLDELSAHNSHESDEQADAPVILIKGGKNSGKSTFARTILNRLTNRYQRVAFIESDLGQSEFTPGGMVSLSILTAPVFGPPFTHQSIPQRAHFIGGASPKNNPAQYLAGLNDLAQYYQLELKYPTMFVNDMQPLEEGHQNRISSTIPLIINTQGWVKGMGADLLRSIEGIFEPSHIVELQAHATASNPTSLPIKTSDELLEPVDANNSIRRISVAAVAPPLYPPRFSAVDLRSLALMSYFHGHFSQSSAHGVSDAFIERWDTSLSLRAVAPIVVDTNIALESITIIVPGGNDVVASELPRALVCGVVALVAPESPTTRSGSVYVQGAVPPSPQTSRCIGLGIIRGISDTKIQLLTPTPVRELGTCRHLVLGEINLPIWAFLDSDQDESGNELPYLQWGRSIAESAGGERRRIRRNIMRRSQA